MPVFLLGMWQSPQALCAFQESFEGSYSFEQKHLPYVFCFGAAPTEEQVFL